jgi:transcriptional regulator with XRE-family HTH domain
LVITLSNELDPDRSLWHLIAVEVRKHRERHELSGYRLAKILGCHRSTVARIENGDRRLSPKYAAKLDEIWETQLLFTRLVRFAAARDEGDWFRGLTEYEAAATHHRMWEALLIPGLLQTPEYARAALSVGLADDVEDAVERRLARQRSVFEEGGQPHVSVILNWVVLQQPVGDSATMRDQLGHLLSATESPHVNVRVLERDAGAHVGLDGSFTLLTVSDRDVAFADAPERGRLLLDPHDVQRFALRYDLVSSLAASIRQSRALITQALELYT